MQKTRYLCLIFSFIFIGITASCSLSNSGEALSVTSWELVSYGGETPLPGTTVTANFEKGEIRGSAGCNQYFGSYTVRGESLKIEELAWTEMACLDPQGVMQQEQEVMSLLSSAESFIRNDSHLEIITEQGTTLLFRYQAE